MKLKTVRNTVCFLFFLFIAFLIFLWADAYRAVDIDTTEVDRYYDLLKKISPAADTILLSAGVGELDQLETGLERMQKHMGLGAYPISMVYGDQTTPPAFVTNHNGEYMVITVSKKITERPEQLSLLVHELSHVAVWSLDKSLLMACSRMVTLDQSVFKGCDLERVVDTNGFYRGQGIQTLNGLTDAVSFNGEGYTTEKKLFGYLKPEQFGYLLARFCADHGIPASHVAPFLESAGRKYFNIGRNHLEKSSPKTGTISGNIKGIYFCPGCGQQITVEMSGDLAPEIKCSKCLFHLKTRGFWQKGANLLYEALEKFKHDFFKESSNPS